jgi:hypothetical protein
MFFFLFFLYFSMFGMIKDSGQIENIFGTTDNAAYCHVLAVRSSLTSGGPSY